MHLSLSLDFGASTDCGGKSQNQDNFLCIERLFDSEDYALFAIFDGHGKNGALAATYVKSILASYFTNLNLFISSPRDFLIKVFTAVHEDLSANAQIDTFMSGTTMTTVVVCLKEARLIVANVGDCRMVLAYLTERTLQVKELTVDHTCFEPKELDRVLRCGARVEQDGNTLDGPLRIYKGTLPYPGIVVTRSLGDDSARKLGILHIPEVWEYSLNPSQLFIILATDGVWDCLTNHQACSIVLRFLEVSSQRASQELTRASLEALEKERVDDNTTNIVVRFKWKEGFYDNDYAQVNGQQHREHSDTWSSID